jgi:ribonuclease Z
MAHHTSPQQAGTVFSKAHPKLAVFTHIVTFGANMPPPTSDEIAAQTRQTYQGPLQVGSDLMQFTIAEAGVSVSQAR